VERGIARWIDFFSVWMLTCGCSLFLGGTVCAEETKPLVPEHTFAIGVGLSHFDFQEDISGGVVEVDGPMYGVVGSYTYHNKIMLNASLDYSRGDLDYYGGWFFGGTPSKADEEDWIVECRGLMGYDYTFRGKHVVTPFLGIGYRYRNIDLKGFGGFEREEEYWYSPIGMTTSSPLFDKWTWGLSLEYDLFWKGKTDYDRYYPSFDLDSGYGVRSSVRFGRQLTENTSLSFEPYITYWDIDESDVETFTVPGVGVAHGVEPANETTTYGLRMIVEF